MDPLTQDLLAARDGDRRALARAVRSSQAEVWRLCAHLVGRAEADDVTQEVYARVFRSLPGFRGDASARTWLLAIARRACADEIRARVRRRRRAGSLRSWDAAPDHGGSVELVELLAVLDPDRREAFVLTQVLGASYREAAAVCGVPVGTIRSRIARARDDLMATLRAADAG